MLWSNMGTFAWQHKDIGENLRWSHLPNTSGWYRALLSLTEADEQTPSTGVVHFGCAPGL